MAKEQFLGLPKIGEGHYREVFLINKSMCMKVPKPIVEKRLGPLRIKLPSQLYILGLGTSNFNKYEYRIFRRLYPLVPEQLRGCFGKIYGVSGNCLFAETIRDYDDKLSKTIEETGRIQDKGFWKLFFEVRDFFISNNISFFGGIDSKDILVKHLNATEAIPVFIDFKRTGSRQYLFQPWLRLNMFAKMKVERRFNRIFDRYTDSPEACAKPELTINL